MARTIGAATMVPLWLHGPLSDAPDANLATGVLSALGKSGIYCTPEGILHYVYAVLNSPQFRHEYVEGLRYDFARIPFARDPAVFAALSRAGEQLVKLHLFEHPDISKRLPRMDGGDLAELTTPTFSAETQTVHLAAALTATPGH